MAKRKLPDWFVGTAQQYRHWVALFKLIPGYDPIKTRGDEDYFDPAKAQLACDFFPECCHHVKGEWAGQPLELARWQQAIIGCLFGWIRENGTRRYRKQYQETPRKNGKSTLIAGIGNKLLFADGEPGADVYSAAADREQAAIVFEVAKNMVEADDDLAGMSESYRRSIVVPESKSAYKVLSADVPTKHGLNASGILFDELHTQPNRDLYDVLSTSTGSRRQPLEVYITTAGYDKHSICYEMRMYAEKVRDGVIHDPSFLPVIYAAKERDNWKDRRVWKRVNPNLGVSVKMEYLERKFMEALETPAAENTFKRLHLDIWTESVARWISSEKWNKCDGPVDEGALIGQRFFGGIDLASTMDVTAFVALFEDEGAIDVVCRFWIPKDNIAERVRRDRVPYDQWVRDGFMTATPGNVVDYDVIRADIKAFCGRHEHIEIGYDPWNAQDLCNNKLGNLDGLTMVQIAQTMLQLAGPTKELEKLIMGQGIRHGGNPVLKWMAANCMIYTDSNGNQKPDKKKSTEKIDGIMALLNALARLTVAPEQRESIYETEGIFVT